LLTHTNPIRAEHAAGQGRTSSSERTLDSKRARWAFTGALCLTLVAGWMLCDRPTARANGDAQPAAATEIALMHHNVEVAISFLLQQGDRGGVLVLRESMGCYGASAVGVLIDGAFEDFCGTRLAGAIFGGKSYAASQMTAGQIVRLPFAVSAAPCLITPDAHGCGDIFGKKHAFLASEVDNQIARWPH
jgi:hypothetical protein